MAERDRSALLCLVFSSMLVMVPHLANASVPAIFVLGDSTADVGTNSYLEGSKARADFPHNGIDFPFNRPTGRFSNGFNSADLLSKLMGFKRSPPPYLFLQTLGTHRLRSHLPKGVNFASGGSGLLDTTGSTLKVVPLSEQINQFSEVRSYLTATMGPAWTEDVLSKSLFCISVGSNDIFGLFTVNITVSKYDYIDGLITAYETHIKKLHSLGARKFGIISVPPVGCCPSQRLLNATGGCFEPENDVARIFHSELDRLLINISSQLPGMKYALGNAYEMTINVINNPELFKFKNVNAACCGLGSLNAENNCNATANLCSDRDEYLFWDLYHPTQAAAKLAAQTLYGGPPNFVSPINFAQLAEA